jgi:hypothetical protein
MLGPKVPAVHLHVISPVQAHQAECRLARLLHAVGLAGTDHVVSRLVVLEHAPHEVHVLGGIAPVPPGLQIAEVHLLSLAGAVSFLGLAVRGSAPDRLSSEADHELGVPQDISAPQAGSESRRKERSSGPM